MERNLLLISPSSEEKVYGIAVAEFIKYFKQMTDCTVNVSDTDDGVSDLILIGAPAVNGYVAKGVLEGEIPKTPIKAGTDEFAVKTCLIGDRKALLLQGGLGRSTLYAIYCYFELNGCAWFWDGDFVPQKSKEELWSLEFDVFEKPRFKYRGLRYFAHRGCKRFQAEMWSLDDWKKEIDYLVKRRLNMFMLRIGQDDLFQRAFPNDVSYPTTETMQELCYKDHYIGGGYLDRRLFWSLEYRGELRKKILDYAFERGFIHPEDCGTMTHWYSLTPTDFIQNKKPTFFDDNSPFYRETGKVWNILEEKNFNYYMQLTNSHIKEYGKAEIFHTIGFAERLYSSDREKNLTMKKYMYDRYTQRLKEEYPTCPVLIASWDLWGQYKGDEAKRLVSSLEDDQCIIFDYTSDCAYTNNFTNWNVVGNFPYVFGLFHAYACYNDCLGFYDLSQSRMEIAKNDEYCKGMVLWPELSHSDTLMQEFFAQNIWTKEVVSVDDALTKMCKGRYGEYDSEMREIWSTVMPIIQLTHWCMRNDPDYYAEYYFFSLNERYFPWLMQGESEEKFIDGLDLEKAKLLVKEAKQCFDLLQKLPNVAYDNAFILRDITDIARTILSRYTNINLILQAIEIINYRQSGFGKETSFIYAEKAKKLLELLMKVLSLHQDYSLYQTLLDVNATQKVYDGFEITLKNNTINWYCRTGIYESVKEVFIPEFDAMQNVLNECLETGEFNQSRIEKFAEISEDIVKDYLKKPLSQSHSDKEYSLQDVIRECREFFKEA